MINKFLPHLVALFAFLFLNIIYFYPSLEGKVIKQGDIVSYNGMVQEAREYQQQTGEDILWTNSMFGGMPTYQIGGYDYTNFINKSIQYLKLFFSGPIGVFNMAMVCMYILFCVLGISPWISLIGAIGFGLATNNFVLWEAGHTNKISVIATSGILLAGVFSVYKKQNYLLGGVLFAFGVGLSLTLNHIQMSFYLFMGMLVYFVAKLVEVIQKKDYKPFLTGTMVLLASGLIGILPAAGIMLPTYEYTKDTMRGEPILKSVENTAAQSSSETNGLAWDYAMQWSAGGLDLMNILIPGSAGGSSGEKVGKNSAIAKDLTSRGVQVGNDLRAPLYWGKIGSRSSPSSTSGIYYYGAIICFLFLMGAQLVKGSIKWGIIGGLVLMFLLALGENFSLLNKPMFNFFPMYSKFRAPSSILGIAIVLFNFLAILGLWEIVKGDINKEEILKVLKTSTIAIGGICLFFALLGPFIFDFVGQNDSRLEQYGFNPTALIEDRQSLMMKDSLRSLLFILLAAGSIWAYLNKKIKKSYLIVGLAALVILDLWSIGQRYLSAGDFSTTPQETKNPTPRTVDQQILNLEPNGRGFYRVFDTSIDPYNNSSTSYFHNTVGGYSPAKLQRAQDLIDYHLSKGNQQVFDMFNTKYFITQQQELQQNPGALGNAWFVETIKKVNTPNEEIEALTNFNPAEEAVILDDEFSNYIGEFDPQRNGNISLSQYRPDQLIYASNASSDQLAVFSEVWYGPSKGWQAYIDGNPVEHVRANYILRALKVPAGQHTIEFKFEPGLYAVGESVSLISSLLIILGLLGFVGWQFYKGYKEGLFDMPEVKKAPPVVPKKQKIAPTTSSRKKVKKRKR